MVAEEKYKTDGERDYDSLAKGPHLLKSINNELKRRFAQKKSLAAWGTRWIIEGQFMDFKKFNKVMDGLLAVPYKELQQKIEEEKRMKAKVIKKRAKSSPASRASTDLES